MDSPLPFLAYGEFHLTLVVTQEQQKINVFLLENIAN